MSESMKSLDDVLLPDRRMRGIVALGPGKWRKSTLADHHRIIAAETVAATAPEPVRDYFETLRNIALYSWFVYRFLSVAQLHAFSCIEFALRNRLSDPDRRSPGLARLIDDAASQHLLYDSAFRDCPASWSPYHGPVRKGRRPIVIGAEWVQQGFVEYVTYFRNEHAHGTRMLMPDAGRSLRFAADTINCLFAHTVRPSITR